MERPRQGHPHHGALGLTCAHGAGRLDDRPPLQHSVLRLLLTGDALVGDVAGLEVLRGQLGQPVEELLPLGDDVLDRDVDVRPW